jgi:uncharacterized membrane protein
MSELVAIAYPDEAAVTRAEANLAEAIHAGLIDVEDVVVIVRDEDGTVDVRQGSTGVGPAAVGGAMWGGLIGLVFLAPLLGMAVGALAGGAVCSGGWPRPRRLIEVSCGRRRALVEARSRPRR